jgi:hypothetical protein
MRDGSQLSPQTYQQTRAPIPPIRNRHWQSPGGRLKSVLEALIRCQRESDEAESFFSPTRGGPPHLAVGGAERRRHVVVLVDLHVDGARARERLRKNGDCKKAGWDVSPY